MKNKKTNKQITRGAKNPAPQKAYAPKAGKIGTNWNTLFPSLIIFIFSFLLYSNTLNHDFALDDGLMIRDNDFTKKGISGIPDIFSHDQLGGVAGGEASAIYQGGRYRPLSQVLFAIEVQFFGLNPKPFHFIHVLLYSLLCVLIYLVLRKIFLNLKSEKWYLSLPFIAAVIYAAHPIHTEVAANIKSADEVICMGGALLSLMYSLNYLERKKVSDLLLSFLFFVIGMFSKENAVTFIAIVPLVIYFFRKADLKTYFFIILPLLSAAAAYFLVRLITVGFSTETVEVTNLFHNPFRDASFGEHYATVMLTWLKYLLLLIFPHPLTHDYYPWQVPLINWSDYRAFLSLIIFAAIGIYALMTIRKKGVVSFGILFFLVTFSVTSNLLINLGLLMNERFMFMPSLGFAIILAFLVYKMGNKKSLKSLVLFLSVVIILLYSVKTISRNSVWENDYVLYTTDAETSVNSGRCSVIAASLILKDARKEKDSTLKKASYEKASEYFRRGLEIYGDNVEGLNGYGEVSIYLSNYVVADSVLRKALSIDSVNATALNNLFYIAKHYQDDSLNEKSISTYKFLLAKKPAADYYYNMAIVYRAKKEIDSALATLDEAIKFQPDYYKSYNLAAEYCGTLKNDMPKAMEYLEKAYSLDPKHIPTLENMGIVYSMKGDYSKALELFQAALEVDSTDVSIYSYLIKTYTLMGENAMAQKYIQKASQLSGKK